MDIEQYNLLKNTILRILENRLSDYTIQRLSNNTYGLFINLEEYTAALLSSDNCKKYIPDVNPPRFIS